MKAEREIPIEDEPDTPQPSEYDNNEIENELMKKRRKYLSKTDSKGRGNGGGSAIKYSTDKFNKMNNLIMI